MIIGVSGHQNRPSIDWAWVEGVMRWELGSYRPLIGFSCLAVGSDQVFADAVLSLGGVHRAVIPFEGYEKTFKSNDAILKYRRLLSRSESIKLHLKGDHDISFLKAGMFVVDRCDRMVFVWDEEPSHGVGGTGDIFEYASGKKIPSFLINPKNKHCRSMG